MRIVASSYLLLQEYPNKSEYISTNESTDNNDRGFAGSSSWQEQSSSSQSFHVEASSSRNIEFHMPHPSHFMVQRQVMHPRAFVQLSQKHHHIGGGLIYHETDENEALAREWIVQQKFQHEQLHQQEMEMQYSESQAQIQQTQGSHYNNSLDQYMASRQLQMEQLSIQEQ